MEHTSSISHTLYLITLHKSSISHLITAAAVNAGRDDRYHPPSSSPDNLQREKSPLTELPGILDHVLGRPSTRFRKIQVFAVVSFWSLYLLRYAQQLALVYIIRTLRPS